MEKGSTEAGSCCGSSDRWGRNPASAAPRYLRLGVNLPAATLRPVVPSHPWGQLGAVGKGSCLSGGFVLKALLDHKPPYLHIDLHHAVSELIRPWLKAVGLAARKHRIPVSLLFRLWRMCGTASQKNNDQVAHKYLRYAKSTTPQIDLLPMSAGISSPDCVHSGRGFFSEA